jgi:hypothetical protein
VKQRIQAVQRTFWLFCLLAAGAVVISAPMGNDGEVMGVLRELETFQSRFDRSALESGLLAHANAQGSLKLSAIASAMQGEGLPKLSSKSGQIAPRAGVAAATLGRVQALSQPGATLDVAMPEPEALALAIGWRLARRDGTVSYELVGVELTNASATAKDVELEREVEAARVALREAEQAHAEAEEAHTRAEKLVEMRRKWKAPWKSQLKARERRNEALQTMRERADALDAARKRHASLADKALAFKGGAPDPDADHAAARIELRTQPGGERIEMLAPTTLKRRNIAVPPLAGAELPVTRNSALWDELAALSLDDAIANVGQRFSWHYGGVDVAGFKVGGPTVLQLAPLLLLVILAALLRRTRVVRRSYNPFDVPAGETLPIVGFGWAMLNLVPLIVLPVAASVLSAWSLVQLDTLAALPALAGVGAIALGSLCFTSLRELTNLRNEVTRAHSQLPVAPAESE